MRFFFLFVCAGAFGQSFSLPLEGYYHPGRAMPVRWEVPVAGGAVELSATGAVTTRIDSTTKSSGITPWLVIQSETGKSEQELPPLHALDDNDQLIVSFVPGASAADDLEEGAHRIRLYLDPQDLASPPMAWQTVDTFEMNLDQWRAIPIATRRGFIADGISVVVRGDDQPDGEIHWERTRSGWLSSPVPKLPPVVSTDAYAPVADWNPGRPVEFRRRIVLFGAIYCLMFIGIALWRSRWTFPALVASSIAAVGFFAIDGAKQSPVQQQGGTVLLTGRANFADTWLYQIAHRPADFAQPVDGSVRPVLSDSSELTPLNLTLHCNGAGYPESITGRLSADIPLAIMRRRMTPMPEKISPTLPATTPLRLLATPTIYPHSSIAGEIPSLATTETWPTLVLTEK